MIQVSEAKVFSFLHITDRFKRIGETYLLTEISNVTEKAHQTNIFVFTSSFYNTLQSI